MNASHTTVTTASVENAVPEKIVNGMSVTGLIETIRAIRNQPDLANFKFRARNRWIDGGRNQATVDDFYGTSQELRHAEPFVFDADEPPVLLGSDQGANPVEYLLTALSGCMTTTLAFHSASRGLEIESISSEYEGDIDMHGFLDLDPETEKGYREIRVKFKVKGDPDEETIRELVEKSPVYNSVANPVRIKVEIEKE